VHYRIKPQSTLLLSAGHFGHGKVRASDSTSGNAFRGLWPTVREAHAKQRLHGSSSLTSPQQNAKDDAEVSVAVHNGNDADLRSVALKMWGARVWNGERAY